MRGWNAAKRLHCKCGISSLHSYPCMSSLFGPLCWDTWRKKSSLYERTNCWGESGGRRVCGMIRISHASSLPILSWRGVVGKEKNKCIWVKTAGKHARLPFNIICLTRVFIFSSAMRRLHMHNLKNGINVKKDLESRILFSVYKEFWSYISDQRFFRFRDKSNENEK